MIESAELLGHRPCHEHQHPLVRLTFKQPRSDDAQMFATLLSQVTQAGAAPSGFPLSPVAPAMGTPAMPMATSRLADQPIPPFGPFDSCAWRCVQAYNNCRTYPELCWRLYIICNQICNLTFFT
jgi:hypothetical protein